MKFRLVYIILILLILPITVYGADWVRPTTAPSIFNYNHTLDLIGIYGSNWYNHSSSLENQYGKFWYNHTADVYTLWNDEWSGGGGGLFELHNDYISNTTSQGINVTNITMEGALFSKDATSVFKNSVVFGAKGDGNNQPSTIKSGGLGSFINAYVFSLGIIGGTTEAVVETKGAGTTIIGSAYANKFGAGKSQSYMYAGDTSNSEGATIIGHSRAVNGYVTTVNATGLGATAIGLAFDGSLGNENHNSLGDGTVVIGRNDTSKGTNTVSIGSHIWNEADNSVGLGINIFNKIDNVLSLGINNIGMRIFENNVTTISEAYFNNIINSDSLKGTYTNGEAYVCVYDNGTIFAKDSACS